MARRKQSRGKCAFCGKEMTKGGLTRHLKTCPTRAEVNQKAKGRATTLYHLQAWDKYNPDYWLQLEVRGDAQLADLDQYLRVIWLECCGHMSMFSAGGWDEELAMSAKVGVIFPQLEQLTYIYDFGSSSELVIKLVGERKGKPLSQRPIYLLARNQKPEFPCQVCGKSADYLCMECLYEDNATGLLCAEHEASHPHEDYGDPHELLNSPRIGMCGPIDSDQPPY